MIDRVVGFYLPSVSTQGFSAVWIDVEPGKVAGRDVEPDGVSLFEQVAGWVENHRERIDLARLQEDLLFPGIRIARSEDAIGQVQSVALGIVPNWEGNSRSAWQ